MLWQHFGFICREGAGYLGYVFQCDSPAVVEDILQGLRSAFQAAHEQRNAGRAGERAAWYRGLSEEVAALAANPAKASQ